MAISAYQEYLGRAQASESVELLGALKSPIAEHYGQNSDFPTIAELQTLTRTTQAGKYVNSITTAANSGVYVADFKTPGVNAKLTSKTIAMTYITSTGQFIFSCVSLPQEVWSTSCK